MLQPTWPRLSLSAVPVEAISSEFTLCRTTSLPVLQNSRRHCSLNTLWDEQLARRACVISYDTPFTRPVVRPRAGIQETMPPGVLEYSAEKLSCTRVNSEIASTGTADSIVAGHVVCSMATRRNRLPRPGFCPPFTVWEKISTSPAR